MLIYSATLNQDNIWVHAEIVRKTTTQSKFEDLVNSKDFGNVFLSKPKQRHYNQAKKWLTEQLNMLQKNTDNEIVWPDFLKTLKLKQK
jgi:hypothetical protein